MQGFLDKFRRITYSTSYLPQVDGLRFLALFSVVAIMHTTNYLDEKFYDRRLIPPDYLKMLVLEGGNGVSLFFIISGFILSFPFAQWRLAGGKKVSLRNYYLRRLTRLEPPYLIALVLLFAAHVWVLHSASFAQMLPHLGASAVYLHTLIYHSFSPVLPIAWSLEVEVQFYVLAPLFFSVFLIRSAPWRRALMVLVIVVNTCWWYDTWTTGHVFMYLQNFFMGLLLADLYVSRRTVIPTGWVSRLAGGMALLLYFFLPSLLSLPAYLGKLLAMFVLFHTVLTDPWMRKLFSVRGLVLIGGMCYSIYLLHLAILSCLGTILLRLGWASPAFAGFPAYYILFLAAVLVISALYFLGVEKPFMRPLRLLRRKEAK